MGFNDDKRRVIGDLINGNFSHASRNGSIDEKNKLQTGEVTAKFVSDLLRSCRSNQWVTSPHHTVKGVDVHIVIIKKWYIKFYFLDPSTMFISVHEEGQHEIL